MDPARWRRIEEIYEAAADRKPDERAAFLAMACAGDEDLGREVASLLAQPSADGMLDRPVWEPEPCGGVSPDAARLIAGQRVTHYQIQEKIGVGGMGAVYRAYDTQLRRAVALKVLPPEYAADPGRRSRLLREARVASVLNHPNIVGIHEVGSDNGVDFIVMELVEGKPLGDVIPAKGLPLGKALDYAGQIASGLAKAHAGGVVHRDLKPGNIMLTRDGMVKLLDFGLARQVELGEGHDTTLTVEGEIMGTPAYMSPEQAQGKPVDVRTDVFSFGCVLYQMVSGHQAFEKDSAIATLAAVVEQEPRPLPPGVPRELERIIARCLRKDPTGRFQHMDDVKVELEEVKEELEPGPTPRRGRRIFRIAAITVAGLLLSTAVLVWRLRETMPSGGFKVVPLTSYPGLESYASFSPDGNKVAFSWNGEKEDNFDIYVKQIDASGTPVRLTTDPAVENRPSWSPDDRWIAFCRQQRTNVAVVLMPSLGGPERKLTEIAGFSDLCWTPDAKWLAFSAPDSPQGPSGIWLIHVDTGERRRLTTFVTHSPGAEVRLGDLSPSISPDGSALAFARQVKSYVYELYVQRITRDLRPEGEPLRVTDRRYANVAGIAWTSDNREIVYGAGGVFVQSLWRVPVSGRGVPQRLPYALPAATYPAISGSPPGLVYTWTINNINLWRMDLRTGERKLLIGSTYDQRFPSYSPDGHRIAFNSNRSGNIEVWTCDADGSSCIQITAFEGPQGGTPRWSPDGHSLALDSREEGQSEIYVVAADGGKPRRITEHPASDVMPSWSHDGRWIYFSSDRSGKYDLWRVAADGGEASQVTRFGGYRALQSPDGVSLYYTKFSSGGFQTGLFRMPAQGGDETQVLDGPVGGFGVTSKGVYFQPNPRAIQFLDPLTGKVSTIAALDKPGPSTLSVSPDDRYVVWSQRDRINSDLMLVDGFR